MLRASTSAIGTPSATHNTVLAVAVRRLSASAVSDEGLVISDQKCGQSTFTATASNGSPTKAVPTAAGRYTSGQIRAVRANTQPPADGHLDNFAEPAHPLLALHRNGVLGAPQWGGTRRRRR